MTYGLRLWSLKSQYSSISVPGTERFLDREMFAGSVICDLANVSKFTGGAMPSTFPDICHIL